MNKRPRQQLALLIKLLISALMLCCINGPVFATERATRLVFDRLLVDSEDDQSIGPLRAIEQDQDGFMWFGGENGLVRYDGHEYRYYFADPNDPFSLSSNYIWCLFVDDKNRLWVGTEHGLNQYDPESETFKKYMPDTSQPGTLAAGTIYDVDQGVDGKIYIGSTGGLSRFDEDSQTFTNFLDSQNRRKGSVLPVRDIVVDGDQLWLASLGGGLIRFNIHTQAQQVWRHDAEVDTTLASNDLESLAIDDKGRLWIVTYGAGISRMESDERTFTHFKHDPKNPHSIGSDSVWQVYRGHNNALWFAADHGGLARWDEELSGFVKFKHNAADVNSISSDQVRFVFESQDGDLWVGTFPAGVNYVNKNKAVFSHLVNDPRKGTTLLNNGILAIEQDQRESKGTIWIGNEGGLNAFIPGKGIVASYAASDQPDDLLFNAIISLETDLSGDIWVGSWSGGLHRFNPRTGKFKRYFSNDESQIKFPGRFIWDIYLDDDGDLWVATERHGVARYLRETDSFEFVMNQKISPLRDLVPVWTIEQDADGLIWMGTSAGLLSYDKKNNIFQAYFKDNQQPTKLQSDYVYAVRSHSSGKLMVATEGGGLHLFDKNTQIFKQISTEAGLPSSNISSVLEDQNGDIWVTTPNGIAKITFGTWQVSTYTKKDGLVNNLHNRDASHMDRDGKVYLGSANGITIFHPDDLQLAGQPSKPVFTNFYLYNDRIRPDVTGSPLKRSISRTSQLSLRHNQNMFAFEFSSLDFRNTNKLNYAYQLIGFDQRWRYLDKSRMAIYTNVDPGHYALNVKASRDGRTWSKPAVLSLEIQSTPWRSWWAYCIYSVVLLALFYLVFRYRMNRVKLAREQAVNSSLIKLDEIKDAFLANTSHELRTPISAMVGVAESLQVIEKQNKLKLSTYQKIIKQAISNGEPSEKIEKIIEDWRKEYLWVYDYRQQNLELLASSGRRLSHLINDILDYSKLENHDLKLQKNWVSLRQIVENIFRLLKSLADDKLITLVLQAEEDNTMIFADSNRLQQIIINLVTNAIKYSEGGTVTVKIQYLQNSQHYVIRVSDQGIGISSEKLENIFTAFDQLDEHSEFAANGTGLGLSVTKKLVELHQGTISVESEVDKGSVFIIDLPSEKERPAESKTATSEPHLTSPQSALREVTYREASGKILIVDDDPINRTIIKVTLESNRFDVVEAKDGFDAVTKIEQDTFDILLSDHNMPGMTGVELCQAVREQHSATKLPFILLTAESHGHQDSQAPNAGINAVLQKPVESEVLITTIGKLLNKD